MTILRFYYESIDSTMDQAKRLVDQEVDFRQEFLIIASSQSAGRGRHGRVWHSDVGNVYLSFVVKGVQPQQLSQFALLWGVILQRTISSFTSSLVQCKWPNDVLLNGEKVAGILIETYKDILIVGVGVNVAHAPSGVQFPATFLNRQQENAIVPADLIDKLVDMYIKQRKNWDDNGFEDIQSAWLQAAWRLGDEITIRQEDRDVVGIMETIDEAGALHVWTHEGHSVQLYVGDLILGDPHAAHH
ncbi:MAG: biotin--[acetyl-CoA-carboxylase] ligase [Alphaproteobacteria bacterium]|nr:biotin--[acetyl-CoA-carboxylase] ligase [Alphaproteobacteria bacterium]